MRPDRKAASEASAAQGVHTCGDGVAIGTCLWEEKSLEQARVSGDSEAFSTTPVFRIYFPRKHFSAMM
jgi:hypothetical protein